MSSLFSSCFPPFFSSRLWAATPLVRGTAALSEVRGASTGVGVGAPGREQCPGRHTVRLVQLIEHLLVQHFVVIRHTCPLAQKRHHYAIDMPGIFIEKIAFGRPDAVLERIELHAWKLC